MDLTGERFGHLTVIKAMRKGEKRSSWLCICDCGNEVVYGTSNLLGGKSNRPLKSCGCKEKKLNGESHKYPKLYAVYLAIIQRCYKPGTSSYDYYGAKGIKVCDEWLNSFNVFSKWAFKNGYNENLWIERIDVDGNYTPENCTWVNTTVQAITRGPNKNNKLGIKGVCPLGERYRAYISFSGNRINLGVFDTIEEAAEARRIAEEKYHKPLIDKYIK